MLEDLYTYRVSGKKATQQFVTCVRTHAPIFFKLAMLIVRKMAKLIDTKVSELICFLTLKRHFA